MENNWKNKRFILEYSDVQKAFHHNMGREKPNTNTYYTLDDDCTWLKSSAWSAFQLVIDPDRKSNMRETYIQFQNLLNELDEHGLAIQEVES